MKSNNYINKFSVMLNLFHHLEKRLLSSVEIAFIVLALLSPFISIAQKEKKFLLEGNKNYNEKKYDLAEKNYKQALSKNKDSYKSSFNLGDAYYQQGKYEEAAEQFQALTHRATSKDTLSKAYHNLGNSLLKSKKYKESIDAYKNALKNNPDDEDTRYNLACAQQYLKQQQQQQNQDKKDDKKDNKKEEEQKKDNKEQNKKEEQKKEEQQKNEISKEDAKRLLDALQNDEKKLQNRPKKQKSQGVKVQIEKDW